MLSSFVCALEISGQPLWPPAEFVPAAPTEFDQIRAGYELARPADKSSTSVTGTLIRTDVFFDQTSIIEGPPVDYSTVFGPLPSNTYTYEIYLQYSDGTAELRSRQSLVISAAAALVPTLSPTALAGLIVALAAVALFAAGRPTGK